MGGKGTWVLQGTVPHDGDDEFTIAGLETNQSYQVMICVSDYEYGIQCGDAGPEEYDTSLFNAPTATFTTGSNETPSDTATTPASPTNLQGTALSQSQIRVTWRDNADNELSYNLYYKAAGDRIGSIVSLDANVETYTLTRLAAGTDYRIHVCALNDADYMGCVEDKIIVQTQPDPFKQTPAVPSDVTITEITDTSALVSWSDNSFNEQGFKVTCKSIDLFWGQNSTRVLSANRSSYRLKDLVPGTSYRIVVCAFNTSKKHLTQEACTLEFPFKTGGEQPPGPTLPCLHYIPEHPAGHPSPNVPCGHWVSEHPAGDPLPNEWCTHFVVPHPAGHPAPNAACLHYIVPHPDGHNGWPCLHAPVPQHPNGHPVPNADCLHPPVLEHPDGHPVPNGPCVHMVQEHSQADPAPNVPCMHIVPAHPEGHEVPPFQ